MTKQELTDKEKTKRILDVWLEKGAIYKKTISRFEIVSEDVYLRPPKDVIGCGYILSFNDILLDSNIFEVLFNYAEDDFVHWFARGEEEEYYIAFMEWYKEHNNGYMLLRSDYYKATVLMSKDRIGTLYDLLFSKDHD